MLPDALRLWPKTTRSDMPGWYIGSEIFGGLGECGVGGPKKLLLVSDLYPRFCRCLFFKKNRTPSVIADPASRPGSRPVRTRPAVLVSSVFCGSTMSGLLVPLALLVADACEDAAVDDTCEGAEVVESDGVDVVVVALDVWVCFVKSLIRQDAPSLTHSYPSGQQPLPQLGKGNDVSLACRGDSGNWLGSWNFVSQIMVFTESQLLPLGQHNAAASAPVLFRRMQLSPVEQQKFSGRS